MSRTAGTARLRTRPAESLPYLVSAIDLNEC